MKKLYRIIVFSSALLLSGCTSDQNVEQLKVQNTVLQQEIQSQKTLYVTTPTKVNKKATKSNTDTYTANKKIDIPSAEPIYNNITSQSVENDYSQKTSCCKVCSKGKACGDSCISRNYTCHKGRGCACDR